MEYDEIMNARLSTLEVRMASLGSRQAALEQSSKPLGDNEIVLDLGDPLACPQCGENREGMLKDGEDNALFCETCGGIADFVEDDDYEEGYRWDIYKSGVKANGETIQYHEIARGTKKEKEVTNGKSETAK